jgi:hypothetical protein
MRLAIRTEPAGESANARYQEGLKAWRRRVLGPVRWITWPLVLACIVAGQFAHGEGRFIWGLGAGAFLSLYVIARDSPPAHIENWSLGAVGEKLTARALRPLQSEGWTMVHDLRDGKGNLDHAVVGGGGLFLLDSKHLGGEPVVREDGVLEVHRRDLSDDVYVVCGLVARMRAQAASLKEKLREETSLRRWVEPVVVLWPRFPQRVVHTQGVWFISGEGVLAWLRAREHALADDAVAQLAAGLQTLAGRSKLRPASSG